MVDHIICGKYGLICRACEAILDAKQAILASHLTDPSCPRACTNPEAASQKAASWMEYNGDELPTESPKHGTANVPDPNVPIQEGIQCSICVKTFRYPKYFENHNESKHEGQAESRRIGCQKGPRKKYYWVVSSDIETDSEPKIDQSESSVNEQQQDTRSPRVTDQDNLTSGYSAADGSTQHSDDTGFTGDDQMSELVDKKNRVYPCTVCSRNFDTVSGWRAHMNRQHKEQQQQQQQVNIETANKNTKTKKARKWNAVSVVGAADKDDRKLGEMMYRCDDCYHFVRSLSGYRTHRRRYHGDEGVYTKVLCQFGDDGQRYEVEELEVETPPIKRQRIPNNPRWTNGGRSSIVPVLPRYGSFNKGVNMFFRRQVTVTTARRSFDDSDMNVARYEGVEQNNANAANQYMYKQERKEREATGTHNPQEALQQQPSSWNTLFENTVIKSTESEAYQHTEVTQTKSETPSDSSNAGPGAAAQAPVPFFRLLKTNHNGQQDWSQPNPEKQEQYLASHEQEEKASNMEGVTTGGSVQRPPWSSYSASTTSSRHSNNDSSSITQDTNNVIQC